MGWLVEAYEPWVRLPSCWPRHVGLRSELVFFQAWHERILEGDDPYEGVNWHTALRSAAMAWQELAGCRHDDQPWRSKSRVDVQEFEQHLERAMAGTTSPSARKRPGRS